MEFEESRVNIPIGIELVDDDDFSDLRKERYIQLGANGVETASEPTRVAKLSLSHSLKQRINASADLRAGRNEILDSLVPRTECTIISKPLMTRGGEAGKY
jgi:hypothetical protein